MNLVNYGPVTQEHSRLVNAGDSTFTPQNSLILNSISDNAIVYRFDVREFTSISNELASRPARAGIAVALYAKKALEVITNLSPFPSANRVIASILSSIARTGDTPAELARRESARNNGNAGLIAQLVAGVFRGNSANNNMRWGSLAGDSYEGMNIVGATVLETVYAPALSIFLMAKLGQANKSLENRLQIRFAAQEVSPEKPLNILLDSERQHISAVSGAIFADLEKAEAKAEPIQLNAVHTMNQAIRIVLKALGKSEAVSDVDIDTFLNSRSRKAEVVGRINLAEEGADYRLQPFLDYAFARVSQKINQIKFDPEIENLQIENAAIKAQLQMQAIISKYKCKLIKPGPIKEFTNAKGESSLDFYLLLSKENINETSVKDFYEKIDKIYKDALAHGIILHIGFASGTEPIVDWENPQFGIKGDITGIGPIKLARIVGQSVEESKLGQGDNLGGVWTTESTIRQLLSEGFNVTGADIFKLKLKGLQESEYIKFKNGESQIESIEIYNEILKINTEENLEIFLRKLLANKFSDSIKTNLIERIVEAINIYSNSSLNKRLINKKALILSIVPLLTDQNTDSGKVLAHIVENSVKLTLIDQQASINKINANPKLKRVLNLVSCLVFGRNYPCRATTLYTLCNDLSENELYEYQKMGFIKISEDGHVYPEPILSIYLYTTQSNSERSKNHLEITKYLFDEKKWEKLENLDQYLWARAFLLHFIHDGEVEDEEFENYCDVAAETINFMFDNRLYNDLAATLPQLLKHLERSNKYQSAIDGYRLQLVLALLRTEETDQAQRILNQVEFDDDSQLLNQIGILNVLMNIDSADLQGILGELDSKASDYYQLLEFIIEKKWSGDDEYKILAEHLLTGQITNGSSKLTDSSTILNCLVDRLNEKDCTNEEAAIILKLIRSDLAVFTIDPIRHDIVNSTLKKIGESTIPYLKILSHGIAYSISQQASMYDFGESSIGEVIDMLLSSGDFKLAESIVKKYKYQLSNFKDDKIAALSQKTV